MPKRKQSASIKKFLKRAEKEGVEVYHIEKILEHRVVGKNQLDYFVKFRDLDSCHNYWCADENVCADNVLAEYWKDKDCPEKPTGKKPKRGQAGIAAIKAKRARLLEEKAAEEARKKAETPEERFLNSRPHIRTLMERLEIEARESAVLADQAMLEARRIAEEARQNREEGEDEEEEEELIRVIKIEPEEGGEGDYIVDADGKHYKLL